MDKPSPINKLQNTAIYGANEGGGVLMSLQDTGVNTPHLNRGKRMKDVQESSRNEATSAAVFT